MDRIVMTRPNGGKEAIICFERIALLTLVYKYNYPLPSPLHRFGGMDAYISGSVPCLSFRFLSNPLLYD